MIEIGDLVFAKVKGWSPWPGKIMCKVSPNHYKIFFYGTNEEYMVKTNMLWSVHDNIKKFSQKHGKRKDYSRALEKMKNSPSSFAVSEFDLCRQKCITCDPRRNERMAEKITPRTLLHIKRQNVQVLVRKDRLKMEKKNGRWVCLDETSSDLKNINEEIDDYLQYDTVDIEPTNSSCSELSEQLDGASNDSDPITSSSYPSIRPSVPFNSFSSTSSPRTSRRSTMDAPPFQLEPTAIYQQPDSSPQQLSISYQYLTSSPLQANGSPKQVNRSPQQPSISYQHHLTSFPQQANPFPQQANSSPHQAIGSPQQAIGSPQQAIGSPQQAIRSPQQADNSLQQSDNSLQQADSFLQPDSSILQADSSLLQADSSLLQVDSSLLQDESSLQQSDSSLKQAHSSLQQVNSSLLPDSSIQQADSSLQQADSSLQQADSSHQQANSSHQNPNTSRWSRQFEQLLNEAGDLEEGAYGCYRINLSNTENGNEDFFLHLTPLSRQVLRVEDFPNLSPDVQVTLSSEDLEGVLSGRVNPVMAFLSGRIKATGDIMKLQLFSKFSKKGQLP